MLRATKTCPESLELSITSIRVRFQHKHHAQVPLPLLLSWVYNACHFFLSACCSATSLSGFGDQLSHFDSITDLEICQQVCRSDQRCCIVRVTDDGCSLFEAGNGTLSLPVVTTADPKGIVRLGPQGFLASANCNEFDTCFFRPSTTPWNVGKTCCSKTAFSKGLS